MNGVKKLVSWKIVIECWIFGFICGVLTCLFIRIMNDQLGLR